MIFSVADAVKKEVRSIALEKSLYVSPVQNLSDDTVEASIIVTSIWDLSTDIEKSVICIFKKIKKGEEVTSTPLY